VAWKGADSQRQNAVSTCSDAGAICRFNQDSPPPEQRSSLAHAALNNPSATVFVSAATCWELETKARPDQLPGANQMLPHGVHCGGHRQDHRDPHRFAEDCVVDPQRAA
jgi:hypothetical protein